MDEDYIQPGDLFRLMSSDEQSRLIANIVDSLKNVPVEIQQRMVAHFTRADKNYGDGVARGLGLS